MRADRRGRGPADILAPVRPAQTRSVVRRAAVGSACTALLLLAACSPQQPTEFAGVKGDVADVVAQLGASARKEDGGRICRELLTPKLAEELAARAAGSCPTAVARATRGADYLDVKVEDVTLNGSASTALEATVRATVPDTEKRTRTLYIGLSREGNTRDWQISDLAAPRPTRAGATTP